MRRETRLLAGLGAVAIVGLGALGFLADQYKKRAEAPVVAGEGGPSQAASLVSSFLTAGGMAAPSAEQLQSAGISRDVYDRVRAAAVAWAAAERVEDEALRAALEARGGEVRAALAR